MRIPILVALMLLTPPSFSAERGWFASLFSSEPKSQSERLLETYTDYRSEVLENRIYFRDGFVFFAYRVATRDQDDTDVNLDFRLNGEGMLSVSTLMDSLVKDRCGEVGSKFDLSSASIPEQGVSEGHYVYVLAALEEEFNRQLEGMCSS